MARIFEAPNVIHVCVRPPNVPKDKRIWGVTADGAPFFGVREVDLARREGSPVFVFDVESPSASARLLPIPYNKLECPARTPPPKPSVAAAKVDAKEKTEPEEAAKAEPQKPLPQPIPRETSAVERRVEAYRCTAYAEPGQTRRRSGSGARTCTRVLVHRARTEPVVAESPREVEPPAPADPSQVPPGEVWVYEDGRQTPEEMARLDRAYECLQGVCHARHKNFQKDKNKPAGTHNGQSLSSGGKAPSAGGGAKTTTVKTTTRPASQIDRNAFKAQREAFWKAEAKNNPGKYSPENLEKMRNGRAPTGTDGKPMELHHVDRTPEGGVRPMSRTEHRLGENYKKNHP
ncbi:HNH/ENDO VII family nuclease [Polyangium sp. 15x6]|uniref:HNH/ENDO VII family nuclease n=1 Tax=Polyangium sp. 15x6 TaxID=3042687 RepID=UPI00249C6E1B|nr:HNH/ENDO VII family nuclease [Polyangium sp. 15x6]MDI3282851.1 HNH/ENDO VII family nuclease [Polyangium sp. 15x6]